MSYQLPATVSTGTDLVPVIEDPQEGLRRSFKAGLITIGLLLFGLFALAAIIGTQGAVVGAGEVTVESRVKKIAHPTGGVISAVYVREGQHVKKGDVLMRLDDTVTGANASASGETFEQLTAAAARLTAERDGAATISFPASLTQNPTPAKQEAMAEAQRLFAVRRQLQQNQLAQINERVRQTEQQISSLQAQMHASQKQADLVKPELEGLRSLRDRQLVTVNRLNQVERTAVDLQGAVASYGAQIAQSRARIAEIRQSGFQMVQDMRSQAGTELVDVESRLNDSRVRSASATDAYNRSLVRAPYNGIVAKLAYSTVGGVVPPMETIMEIVPTQDALTIEAHVSPYDIDQLSIGQPATLRFSAFSAQTTPQLNGKVDNISAERITDERTGQSYYKIGVAVSEQERKRLGGLKLVPGMPVEVFVQTTERSLLSYLTKPLRDQFSRAFREN
ncbi:MAG: HlyD family type I secretion periplasmic adaptor subunit [Sphingobium sp.]|jgi:HlyD family type I secretion membrane fusion protein|nr:HlyD family type I secretion periplasmic adaptor subunit [Sphingobium sp.]MCI1271619.1 HlyD family type I secretion periplasmic adaptor subunit [Sphingobium sp.]MCI1757424.1 HlyD family type I secretion periplasmic adaptor subunit [Sphingobium sp.]MCI2054333.1 HlyD family type I secretion periplasmic adaptor subunit [Sphingobium sp.]